MQSIRENTHPRGLARLLGLLALIGAATLASPAWSQATPPRGGTLTWIIPQEPAAFVPLTTSAGGSTELGPKVIEGLLAYDRELKPIAQLATGWQVSADGLRYEFTLRQGVKWHDGQPFTAADAAYSIATIKAVHPRGRVTFANVGAIETPDDYTLVLKLEKPAPYLLTALSASESPIVPKHLYEGKDVATNPRTTVRWAPGRSSSRNGCVAAMCGWSAIRTIGTRPSPTWMSRSPDSFRRPRARGAGVRRSAAGEQVHRAVGHRPLREAEARRGGRDAMALCGRSPADLFQLRFRAVPQA